MTIGSIRVGFPLLAATLLSACATEGPQGLSDRYASMSNVSLWTNYSVTQSPLELAFIEAELGSGPIDFGRAA